MSNLKYALLIGINYRGKKASLKGCINDVAKMQQYLIQKKGYSGNNITVLTDDTETQPTAANIMHALSTLILKAHSNHATELWFHYSGHGSYVRDVDHDEDDNRDETLVPIDYDRSGMITDDTLHDYLEHLPSGCQMTCIIDCCHSGTILDLKYQYKGHSNNAVENPNSRIKGNVLMISGCMDVQTSADSLIQGQWAGAMTTSFLHVMNDIDNITCYSLLQEMRDYLKNHGYKQYPQICSSEQLTNNTQFFL